MVAAQSRPKFGQKGILDCLGKVGSANPGGVLLTASSPGDDQKPTLLTRPAGQGHLGRQIVGCIDHCIWDWPQQGRGIGWGQELIHRRYRHFWDHLAQPVGKRNNLGAAKRRRARLHLAIEVAFRHDIEIDQGEPTDAAARQRLSGPRTDSAHANDHHMGRLKAQKLVLAKEIGQRRQVASR